MSPLALSGAFARVLLPDLHQHRPVLTVFPLRSKADPIKLMIDLGRLPSWADRPGDPLDGVGREPCRQDAEGNAGSGLRAGIKPSVQRIPSPGDGSAAAAPTSGDGVEARTSFEECPSTSVLIIAHKAWCSGHRGRGLGTRAG